MKTKELTRQVRDKVVAKFEAGLGYKEITQALNISRSTIKSIIRKWKKYGTTANLPRQGHAPKLTSWKSRKLIKGATKRPMVTLEELQRSTAEVGESVHGTTISPVLHQSGLNGRVARRKWLLKVNHKKSRLCLPQAMWETQQTCGRRCSSQMRPKLNFLASMQNAMCGGNPILPITLSTPSQQWNMVGVASCCGDASFQQVQGNWSELRERWMEPNTGQSLKRIWCSLQKTWDWGGGSSSSRTMTLNIQPELQWNGLDKSMLMS